MAWTVAVLWTVGRTEGSLDRMRGVHPSDLARYSGQKFACKDGSKTFQIDRFNDDYCDCVDGSDEPGTNACVNGKFYCNNYGHEAKTIYASFVDDGICDCCDGSDEWSGKVRCENNCLKLGEEKRREAEKVAKAAKSGFETRITYIREATKTMKEWNEELHEKKESLLPVSKELDILEKRIAQLEKVEEEKRAAEKTATPEPPPPEVDAKPVESEAVGNADVEREEEEQVLDDVTKEEDVEDEAAMESEEELDPEELGRRVASRWTTDEAAAGSSHDMEDDHPDDEYDHGEEDYTDEDYDFDHEDEEEADFDDEDEDGSVAEEEEHPSEISPRSLSIRAVLDALQAFPTRLKKMFSSESARTLESEDTRAACSASHVAHSLKVHEEAEAAAQLASMHEEL
eukprot:jgi/Pico_ML_1/53123/g3729.t2